MTAEAGLAAQFEGPTQTDWMALVEKALKGANFEKRLVTKTRDGVRIKPLYTRDDSIPVMQNAAPGSAPYARGVRSTPQGLGWEILGLVTNASPAEANKAALAELEGGANGVLMQVAAPGQAGIALKDDAGIAEVLSGVYLDYASVHVRGGLNALWAGGAVVRGLETLGAEKDKARGNLNIAPLEMFARFGAGLASGSNASGELRAIDAALTDTVTLAGEVHSTFPLIKPILADGRIAHEAGASEATELAFLAASTVAYLRAFEKHGVSADDGMNLIAFGLAADADLFLTTAKFRAARLILGRIADSCGAEGALSSLQLNATTSERMMARVDVWTNMLRTAAATAAAALGGADTLLVHPFTWALGQPDAFALRIARNQQILAQEESSLGHVVDPAGGSWYVESLTEELAQAAWREFQRIESAGGIIAALKSGMVQKTIAETNKARSHDIAIGKQQLTGVSAYPLLGDEGVTVTPFESSQEPQATELGDCLSPVSLSKPYEDLRNNAEKHKASKGHWPQVFLASLGSIADHNVRTTWAKNFFAAGGLEAIVGDGFADAQSVAEAFEASGAKFACLCSSDSGYASLGVDTAKALKQAGAERVMIAGKPGDLQSALDAAGLDQVLSAGQDSVAVLRELHEAMAVTA